MKPYERLEVVLENENRNISWESLHMCGLYKDYYKQKTKSVRGIIKISSATHLGLLATGFYCGYTLWDSFNKNYFILGTENIFFIILSIILFMLLIMINKDFYKNYDTELENIMKEYKKEREKVGYKNIEDNK